IGLVVSAGVFGIDGIVGSLIAHMTTEATPPGTVVVEQREIPAPRRGLLHSWLTEDPDTIHRVVEFMKASRPADPGPRQSRVS
ncbi:MAG: hypothetical protein ACKVZ6_05210, partial [Kineosporiaceae bacterium]